MGEISQMSDFPTEDQVRQVYEPIFRFLDSIPQIINETESATESELLSKRADEIESEVVKLDIPSGEFVRLRAIAGQLAEPQRVNESDAWVTEAVKVFGQGIADWVRNTSYHLFFHELDRDGRRELSPFDDRRPEFPFTDDDINRCRDLLVNEEALLIATQMRVVTQGSGGTSDSPSLEKSDKKPQRKVSRGKRTIADRSLYEQILAALKLWHHYDDENFRHEPVTVRELARQLSEASSDPSHDYSSSVSRFFGKAFTERGSQLTGYQQYCQLCNRELIQYHLQKLSGEFDFQQYRAELKDLEANRQSKTERDED